MTDEENDRLRALEFAAIVKTGRSLTVAMLTIMAIIVALVHTVVRPELLTTWCIVYLTYVVARNRITTSFSAPDMRADAATIRRARATLFISTLVFGALLSSIVWIAMPGMDYALKIGFTCFMILVMAVSAISSQAFVFALLAMNITVSIPLVLCWWLVPPADAIVAACLLMQPAVNTFIARNRYRTSRESWEVIVRNERLAMELIERNQELLELGNSRNRLFAVAGHDLRQPVYALGLTIEQLNEYDPPQVLRQHFDRLRESSYLVSEMLQDLMDISNLERKDYPLHIDVVPLGPLLEQLRLSQDAVARAKGLKLEISAGAAGLAVHSDANLMRRILMNLVSNAIKYTIQGKVNIECASDGDEILIRVIDTGIGIPADQLEEVFHDYVRVNGQHRKDDGVGLGLSVVRRAVDLLGHRLTVHSDVGVGSVFELRAKAARLHEPAELPAGNDDARSNAELVLLIEDDDYVRQALSGLLVQWGYTPVTAATAQEALAQLGPAAAPAVIIADLQLSLHEDGFDAIALVRQHVGNMQLPALLLTGDVRPSLIPKAAEQGIVVAHKPLPPPILRQKVQALLDNAAKAT